MKPLPEKVWRQLLEQPFGKPITSLGQHEVASLGQRLAALLLDAWLINILTAMVWVLLGSHWGTLLFFIVVFPLLGWPIVAATPGQWLVGLVVLDQKTLQKLSFGQSARRFLASFLTFTSAGLLLLIKIWDKNGRDTEDYLSKSVVLVDNIRLSAHITALATKKNP